MHRPLLSHRSTRNCLALILAVLLALAVLWHGPARVDALPDPATVPTAPTGPVPVKMQVEVQRPVPAASVAGARAVAPSVPAPSAPGSTYALIVRAQADRSVVVRAQARELVRACRAAVALLLETHRKQHNGIDLWTALDSRNALPRLPDEAPDLHERRQQARELVLTHCDAALRDEQAQNHPSVTEMDRAWRLGFKEALRSQLQAQDFRGAVFQVLMSRSSPVAYFEGIPWGGVSPEGYARALYYALALDPRPSTQISLQLSMAGDCLASGLCDFDLDTTPLFRDPNSPAITAQAHALAPRIYAAMKAGRVEAFLPPEAPRP
jgi:hypothetical protein